MKKTKRNLSFVLNSVFLPLMTFHWLNSTRAILFRCYGRWQPPPAINVKLRFTSLSWSSSSVRKYTHREWERESAHSEPSHCRVRRKSNFSGPIVCLPASWFKVLNFSLWKAKKKRNKIYLQLNQLRTMQFPRNINKLTWIRVSSRCFRAQHSTAHHLINYLLRSRNGKCFLCALDREVNILLPISALRIFASTWNDCNWFPWVHFAKKLCFCWFFFSFFFFFFLSISPSHRDDVKKLFEYWCEITPTAVGEKVSGVITRSFPESFNDVEIIKKIPEFAYPCQFLK